MDGDNLLNVHTWSPEKDAARVGFCATGQRPSLRVSFHDTDNNRYEADYPPVFFAGERK
jgi:hypothetical protein